MNNVPSFPGKRKYIISKSYGKLILAGEHAVIYGAPAVIFPIDKFCEVKITNRAVNSPVNNIDKATALSMLVKNNAEDKHQIVSYVVNKFFQEYKINPPNNLEITIASHIPIGRGFGSSAAVITALVKSLSKFFLKNIDGYEQKLLKFCVFCENLIHKKSSGADIYACWFGKLIYFQNKNGKTQYKAININRAEELQSFFDKSFLIDTGRPIESTGEMVEKVKSLKLKDKSLFKKNIDMINTETEKLFKILTSPPSQLKDVSIHQIVNKLENSLESIGVVSQRVMEFIKKLNSKKSPAKICGAGGFQKGSGIVIAFTKNKKLLKTITKEYNYNVLNIRSPFWKPAPQSFLKC